VEAPALPWIERLRAQLPQGRTLPLESWRARHRAILIVALAHAVAVPAYGVALGFPVRHCLLEGSAIGLLVFVAWIAGRQDRTRLASSAASVSLMTASALIVHLSGGVTEAHFHFFVMIVVLTLYEDWVPFLVSLGYVVLHHGIAGAVDPSLLYSHGPAQAHPWRFAGIHAGFVAAAGAAGVSTWRHNEHAREQALAAKREADQLYRSVVETLNEGVALQGPDGSIRAANASAARILGTTNERMVGASTLKGHREAIHEDGTPWPDHMQPAQVTARTGRGQRDAVMGLRAPSGDVTWISVTTQPLSREGEGWSVVTSVADITDRRRAQVELQRLADRDPLTGLLNRRRLESDLSRCLAEAGRFEDAGAVLVLDLDNFKYVNDSLGHAVGDELICAAALAIESRLREIDSAARLGGDEFAVILPRADEEEAGAVAAHLLDVVRDAVVNTVDGPRRTTASAGIAVLGPGQSTQEVMAQADMAMYEAKELGKDRVVVFDPGGDRQAQAKAGLSWAERIRSALAEDRLFLEAQPIVALDGSDPDKRYELLVRMRTEEGETVAPGVFLPVAERFDLMRDIDRWVLARAAGILGELRRAGRVDVHLSVNLSPRSLDMDMLGLLRGALETHDGDPRRLTVEITETAAIADLDRAQAFASALSGMGIRLALDDFGAGFASFQHLTRLHFDEIKIDGEYVRNLADDATHQVLVRSLVDLARGLGKDTTAEFVADDPTMELLREYGVRWAQGFHLGRPGPLESLGLAPQATALAQ
jgi:diguanylate cyclase (GGDEF)-like protein/PAS domain S-box-containing protein